MSCAESKAVIAIGYEHDPAQVPLEPLWKAFELVAEAVLNIKLGARVEATRDQIDSFGPPTIANRSLES